MVVAVSSVAVLRSCSVEGMIKYLGAQEHRDLAREAVRKSLVLLKNGQSADEPLLPLPKKATRIQVAGTRANNIGNQCGGWTIEWQGASAWQHYSRHNNPDCCKEHYMEFKRAYIHKYKNNSAT